MPIPVAFLLAAQAGGMIVDYMGKSAQIELGRMGNQVEQASIDSNIQSSRLESEEASLQAMKQLRMNLGTQAAMLAARGTRAGAGTAALFGNESVGNFNADERIRKINQRGRETAFAANKVLSNLHQTTTENNIWGQFRKSIIDKIPTAPDAYSSAAEKFGLTKIGG